MHEHSGKISGASAHVDNKDYVSHVQMAAEIASHRFDPRVEGRLRFLQQVHIFESRRHGSLDRQVAGGRVERSRYGKDDIFICEFTAQTFQRSISLTHMVEDAIARLDRRNSLEVRGCRRG